MTSSARRKREMYTRQRSRYAAYKDLAVTYEGYSEAIPVRAPDLSPYGIFINTSHPFPEGAVLCVEFRLARTDTPIKIRGEVRYCLAGVGVGVEFIDISPEARRAIEEELTNAYGVA